MSIKRVNTSFRLVTLVAVDGVITPNADLGNLFRHTATGDVTLASPVNGDEAQVLDVQVYASGGARNLTAGGATISIPSGAWWWGRLSFDEDHDSWILDDGTGVPGGGGVGGGSSYTDEQVRDVMGAALVAGSNVTITPNDGADTITIAAATSGASGIPASTVDAKGDLIAGTANDTVARHAVGANGTFLRPNSAVSTGLEWGPDPLARANHTGTQAISTVTNLQTSLDAKADLSVTHNTQTGTSYTLVLSDAGRVVEMNNASAMTVTVPPNSSVAFPVGTVIELVAHGTGSLTVAPGSGVTIRTPASSTARAQYSTIALRKRATDEWVLSGDLS